MAGKAVDSISDAARAAARRQAVLYRAADSACTSASA